MFKEFIKSNPEEVYHWTEFLDTLKFEKKFSIVPLDLAVKCLIYKKMSVEEFDKIFETFYHQFFYDAFMVKKYGLSKGMIKTIICEEYSQEDLTYESKSRNTAILYELINKPQKLNPSLDTLVKQHIVLYQIQDGYLRGDDIAYVLPRAYRAIDDMMLALMISYLPEKMLTGKFERWFLEMLDNESNIIDNKLTCWLFLLRKNLPESFADKVTDKYYNLYHK